MQVFSVYLLMMLSMLFAAGNADDSGDETISALDTTYQVELAEINNELAAVPDLSGVDNGQENGATPVPEPSTMILLGSALAGLFGIRKKR